MDNCMEKFSTLIQRWLDFMCTACFAWLHFLYYITESVRFEPGFSYFLQLWRKEWACNGLKNVTKGWRDVKEGGISARKAGLLWDRLSMKKSTLQVRLNRRVTFDRRIEVPSPSFIFFLIKNEEKKSFADWLIEHANRGFCMSTDAFLKSVKKFFF